jgi:hypothetical protein
MGGGLAVDGFDDTDEVVGAEHRVL